MRVCVCVSCCAVLVLLLLVLVGGWGQQQQQLYHCISSMFVCLFAERVGINVQARNATCARGGVFADECDAVLHHHPETKPTGRQNSERASQPADERALLQ